MRKGQNYCHQHSCKLLRPGLDIRRRHVRWSCGYQVRQVGFLYEDHTNANIGTNEHDYLFRNRCKINKGVKV